jgi:hypothetical protein
VSRRRPPPAPAVIDASCLIDLLVSGLAEEILRANAFIWNLPIAGKDEVRYIRRYDASQPGALINEPADLGPHLTSGLLTPCQPDDPPEEARFVHYAAHFRSDGEAMCLALAESRGWTVATDDRKAILIAAGAGQPVISCPPTREGVGRCPSARPGRARPGTDRHRDPGPVPAEPVDARIGVVLRESTVTAMCHWARDEPVAPDRRGTHARRARPARLRLRPGRSARGP